MKSSVKSCCLSFAVLLILIFPMLIKAQAPSGDTALQLKELLNRYSQQKRFNGVVLIAKEGKPILSEGYGMANMEFQIKNTPETRFVIASVTKTFTASLIMRLIDQGKLSLDTRLSDVLTWYRKDVGEKVTIRQLLNHTSGIPNYMNMKEHSMDEMNRQFGTVVIDKLAFAKKYCMYDLEYEPGSRWNYNNTAYFLLGMIIEQVNGKSYEASLKELIFDPLRMENSGDIQPDPERVVDNLATGYIKKAGSFSHMPYWNISTAYAAGSLYSTLDDLLKYDQALSSSSFLSEKAREAMFTPGLNNYGCGWELRQLPIGINSAVKNIQTHEGFLWAWHTRIFRIPEDGYFIVILSNTGNAPLERMFTGVTDILYHRTPEFPKPTLTSAVETKYKTMGVEQAIAYGKSLLQTQKNEWENTENDINSYGYQLILLGKVQDAVKVLKWNTELYPQSWNVWDSYGEALALAGNTGGAIEAYEQSIKLCPENKGGIEMLKKLRAGK